MEERKHVVIYTDGACLGNPGPGGYGVILTFNEKYRELSGGYKLTTNNRMELMGAISGLRALKYPCKVTIFSDSSYVVRGIQEGWAARWKRNGWMKNAKDPAINPDLWQELLSLCEKHDVTLQWVKGHAGHPQNERCDELSVEAANLPDLPPDPGYPAAPRGLFK